MKDSIFSLVPERVKYDDFWTTIRNRNRWLIMLRYGAVVMITCLILGIYVLQEVFRDFYVNTFPLWIVAFSILLYNILFHKIWQILPDWKKEGFHSLHFSLIQICTDFISLMLFIYFMGGIETPLYGFFIFHVIIGSLFLPGTIITMIISCVYLITLTGAILEFYKIIPHNSIHGLLPVSIYDNTGYLLIFFTFFGITLFLSIYLTNSISKELYSRERALNQAYRELANAEKTKSRYVMSIVHDLKTPIVAALAYLNMLTDGTLGELQSEQVRPVDRSKLRLNGAINTINNILNISMLKLEEDIGNVLPINVKQLFDELYEEIRILFRSKNIQYNYICEQCEKITIKGDYGLMKLAFTNLLTNAYKYTDTGGIVEVKVNEHKDNIEIVIADNGMGIPDKDKEKIFHEFYRSTITKKKGIEGTGLGMAIVLEIFNRYHAKIELKSPSYLDSGVERPGTEFSIIFPV
jgi:signal transduction histidine kinase